MRLIFKLLILFMLFPLSSRSQESLIIDWERDLSNSFGTSRMYLDAIDASNGNAYLGGSRSLASGLKMYVTSISSNGESNWELNIDTEFDASIKHLYLDDDDQIFVVGTELVGNSGNPPIHYARIDPEGNLLWHNTFDANEGTDVELVWSEFYDDHLYMVGTKLGENDYDISWAAKIDNAGNVVWITDYDPGVNTVLTDISVNSLGDVAACGWADYGYSHLLIGFDNIGNVEWSYPEVLTSGSEKWLNDLTSDEDGNWLAVGSEEGGNSFEYDAVTIKFDPDGNELWNSHYSNGGENYGTLVQVTPIGQIIAFVDKEEDFDDFVRVISYNTNGDEEWSVDYDIDTFSSLTDAAINTAGEIFMAIRDLDQNAIVQITPTGQVFGEEFYDEDVITNFTALALDNSNVYTSAFLYSNTTSKFISLEQIGLSEIAFINFEGIQGSDARVGALTSDNQNVWLADLADSGNEATYSVSKFDFSGNLLWTSSHTRESSTPNFKYLEHDQNGNVIGFYESLINGGVTDLDLVKYDVNGNEVFTVAYDSSASLLSGAICTDPLNNIFAGGYNQTSKIMFLSKFDPNGNEIWREHYISPSTTFPYAIPIKMIYTAQDKLVFAAIEKDVANVNNIYLFQYDSDGNLEWHEEVDNQSGNLNAILGLEVDAQGDIVVFGSSGTATWVAASYDSSGNEQWTMNGSTSIDGYHNSMSVDPMGNAYLGFSSETSANFIKLDADGNEIATAQHSILSDGTFFYPRSSAVIGDKLAIIGDHLIDGVLFPFELLLDTDLNFISGRIDLERSALFGSLSVNSIDQIHAAYTHATIGNTGGNKTAIVREYSIGIVGLDELSHKGSLEIFPNPTDGNVRIKSDIGFPILALELWTLDGRLVDSKDFGRFGPQSEFRYSFPSDLTRGVYLLKAGSSEQSFETYKIILQ